MAPDHERELVERCRRGDVGAFEELVDRYKNLVFAMIMRIAADGYGFALLALRRDRAIAVVAVVSAVLSATATAVMTSLMGLWGAAVAFAASATAIFIVRYCLTAFNGWDTSATALTQGAGHGAR